MGLFFFYNNRKPRQYNYKPILFDPVEEERVEKLNRRIYEIKKDMNALTPEEKERHQAEEIRGEFFSQTKHLKRRKEREEAGKNSFLTNNGLLILILVILLAIFFFWILS